MQNFSASPLELVSSFWKNRSLILTLAKREIQGRYRGSMMGILWSFINPLFMLAIYTFVFSVVFKARWSAGEDSKTEFALVLFAGLIIFNIFSECFSRSPGLILANINYVKKVVFPLEILPWVALASSLFHAMISFIVWMIAYIVFNGVPHITVLLMPFIVLPLIFFTLGTSWLFSALGVYLRDISQLVNMLNTVLMFLTPIFYPISALTEKYQVFLHLNPLTQVVENFRKVMYFGVLPNWQSLGSYYFVMVLVACLGFYFFQKTRKGFADVL